MIAVDHKGNQCYIVDAELVANGKKTMRIKFQGKIYFWPHVHCEFVSTGRCAIKVEFYDMLFQQDKFKKTIMVKATFIRNMGRVPVPKLRKFSKN